MTIALHSEVARGTVSYDGRSKKSKSDSRAM
jgi:hypothetical protein